MYRYICFFAILICVWAAPVDEQIMIATEEPVMELRAPLVVKDEPVMELRAPPVEHVIPPMIVPEMQTRAPVIGIMDAGLQQSTDGAYNFHYRGEDGSSRQESAVVINPGTEYQYLKITGSYSYFDANGKEVVVHYNADDRGFVPEGNNIMQQISTAAKMNSQLPRVEEKPRPPTLSNVPIVSGGVWANQMVQV